MEQLKVLAAALALREFTVDEISGLSGVNPRTVRSVLRRHPSLICRVEGPSLREGAVSAQPSRGRPSNRWMVADGDQVRRLIDEAGALPRFEPNRSSIGDNDRREAAVAVAEDALAQVGSESDEALQGRLIRSARSSLFFGDGDTSSGDEAPWWQTDDSQFAVRARGVNALAALADLESTQPSTAVEVLTREDTLRDTAKHIAEAIQAAPERGEEIYFGPFSHILARSGEFAPLFAVCAWDQEPVFPFAGDWTEVMPANFHTTVARVMTQAWATSLVNVSSSMPIVVSSAATGALVDQVINSMKATPRPAMVFGSLREGGLITKSGLAGAPFVPVGKHSSDRQHAIESVTALIDRFSVGR